MIDEIRGLGERVWCQEDSRRHAQLRDEQVEVGFSVGAQALVLRDVIARGAAHDEQQKETAIEGNRRRRQTFSSKLRTERTVAVSSAMRTTL